VVANNQAAKSVCNLPNRAYTPTESNCAVGTDDSGDKFYYSTMAATAVPESNIGPAASGVADVTACATLCAKEATCVGFSFNSDGGACAKKNRRLRERYLVTWTNYDTEIKIDNTATVTYGELIENFESAANDRWDVYEMISWKKTKRNVPGTCQHSSADGASEWFNICPRFDINPTWCATGSGCEYVAAPLTQTLATCRWVSNDQVHAYSEAIDSRVPVATADLPVWNQRSCLPSYAFPYGSTDYTTMLATCVAHTSRSACEGATNSGTSTDDWRARQKVLPYENMVKADSLTSGTGILSATCGDTTETIVAKVPDAN